MLIEHLGLIKHQQGCWFFCHHAVCSLLLRSWLLILWWLGLLLRWRGGLRRQPMRIVHGLLGLIECCIEVAYLVLPTLLKQLSNNHVLLISIYVTTQVSHLHNIPLSLQDTRRLIAHLTWLPHLRILRSAGELLSLWLSTLLHFIGLIIIRDVLFQGLHNVWMN